MNSKPELLAPVGNKTGFKAAVNNGADAVYLGGKSFNARNRADNFTTQELIIACQQAHRRGVKVYVTVNTLYKNNKIEGVLKFIEEIYQGGVDGVIVQDLGVARLINNNFPDLELHASTQLTVHNLAGAQYIEDLGFSRVVLARELTLTEIKEIINKTNLQAETFVHGALCICYSGQCLMSSLIGGRSGNRGRCAQPCRLPYTLVDRDSGEVVNEQLAQKYLLSPKDINTLELLPELIESKIAAFKIEGRMKRPEYVAAATQVYRKYIDRYFQERSDYQVDKKDQQKLAQLFNRSGFTTGYYYGQDNADLISYQRPKNWGLKIGEVVAYNNETNRCTIKLSGQLNQGDGIEIWTKRDKNLSFQVGEITKLTANKVEIEVKQPVAVGCPVYKTSDQQLLADLRASYQENKKQIEIFGHLQAKLEEKMQFTLWDQQGHYVTTEGEFIPEPAKNQALTKEDFRVQMEKMGQTPYQLAGLELHVDDNLFIPLSKLNQLRRKAINELNQQRERQFLTSKRNKQLKAKHFTLPEADITSNNQLVVQAPLELARAAVKQGVDRVYCTSYFLTDKELSQLINQVDQTTTEIFIRLPRITRQETREEVINQFNKLEKSDIDGFLVPQLGAAELVKKSTKQLVADYSLHNFNSYTIQHWQQAGYEEVTLSPELTLYEVRKLARKVKIDKEVIVYGHLPMMITEYCPVEGVTSNFTAGQNCSKNCQKLNYGLKDRKKMTAPIETDPQTCRTVIYNSQPLYLIDYLDEIMEVNCSQYRLNFTIETREEAVEVIKAYQQKLNNPDLDTPASRKLAERMKQQGYTTGHFYRGVE